MSVVQSIHNFLEYKIEIDLNKRINRNKSFAILIIIALLIGSFGYYIGQKWFFLNNMSYYDYEMKELQNQLKNNANSNEVKAQIAMTSYLNGDIAKAIVTLNSILSEDPKNNSAMLNLGLIYTEQKNFSEGIRLLKQYVGKNTGLESRLAYLYLGQDYLGVGKYRDAFNAFQQAQARDQGNPLVYFYLGQTSEKLKDIKAAKGYYEKALEINQNYTEAKNALENMLKRDTNSLN